MIKSVTLKILRLIDQFLLIYFPAQCAHCIHLRKIYNVTHPSKIMEKEIINRIFDFVALIKYNGEKREILEKALKEFLISQNIEKSIEEYLKDAFEEGSPLKKDDVKRDFNNFFTTDELFERHDYILSIDADPADILYYLSEKYSIYDDRLKAEIGFTTSDIIAFSLALKAIYNHDLYTQGYKFNPNVFETKEQAYDMFYLQHPDEKSRKISEFASLLDKEALIIFLKGAQAEKGSNLLIENIDSLLEIISFTIEDLREDNKLRFQDKPLLKLNEETYLILNEVHLLYGLQSRLDNFLNKFSWYSEGKGKRFEKIALKILGEINKIKRVEGKLYENVTYNSENKLCELDGLINFKDFSWFVECKGRIPRSDSFKGNISSVKRDVERGITDAEEQALRAIKEAEKSNEISGIKIANKKGILIVTEGVYPNLNPNPISVFPRKDENYPRYIIGLLTLMEILRQHDIYYLEKFLEWRCDQKMPIHSPSELDYWDYFTKMQKGLDMKEGYDLAIKNNNKVFYIGNRFNASKTIKGE